MSAIQNRLNDLNTAQGFAPGSQPFFIHEVIDKSDGAVTVQEYIDMGWVTEFRFVQQLGRGIFFDWGSLGNLYDPGWGMGPPDRALVFVDNHDTQRNNAVGSMFCVSIYRPCRFQA